MIKEYVQIAETRSASISTYAGKTQALLIHCGMGCLIRKTIVLITIAGLATGCAGQPASTSPDDELHTLPGRFAEEPITQPLVATEAYIGPDEFFVAYESEDGLVYSGGNWSNRVDLNLLTQGPEGDYSGPFILSLEYHRTARWGALPENPIVPRLLSSKQWNRFMDRVFDSALPKAEMTGIVMHFGYEDYFLFNNDMNNFESRLLFDKPPNYVVAETIDFMEFTVRARPIMEEFLTEEGIEDRRIVFSTGDGGAYSLPFVYFDREHPIGIFTRFSPAPREGGTASKSSQLAQTAAHITQSHVGGLVTRPVSSLYRLLFLAGTEADLGTLEVELTLFDVRWRSSRAVDLTRSPFESCAEHISSPKNYSESQALGREMRADGVQAARYKSARDSHGGLNLALFSPIASPALMIR